ncbi:RNA polymerase sigma factor [Streptomyces sp. NPDC127068]|jgi:DNA-directed RNA polymerase specialized sigma24 family protein|uniref:RNA polymerase sigma factor n=1 Tax=Streptomyces sp. NPDC127068 TaxID=3347127 RepID=UPI00365185B4
MTEDDDGGPVVDAVLPLPLDFEAHYLINQEAFHEFALYVLGSNEEAEEAIHRVFLEILRHWDDLLEQRNLQAQTWAIMRRVVISQSLLSKRLELSNVHTSIGLYAALSALPPRQFDVIVLRYVIKYSTNQISWYLGVTPSTVDYHCRKAKERLEFSLRPYIKQEDAT